MVLNFFFFGSAVEQVLMRFAWANPHVVLGADRRLRVCVWTLF